MIDRKIRQKEYIKEVNYAISEKAKLILRRVEQHYPELGGYTESEMKKLASSLDSIRDRLSKLIMNL